MRTAAALLSVTAGLAWTAEIIQPGTFADAGGAGVAAGAAAVALAAGSVGPVDFTCPLPLVVRLGPDQTARTYVRVSAGSDVPKPLAYYLNLRRTYDSTPCRAAVAALSSTGLAKGNPFNAPIEITGCGNMRAEGVIGIAGSTGKQKERPIVIQPHESMVPDAAAGIAFLLALCVAVLCALVVTSHGHKLRNTIGIAKWEFGSSWASNVTALGTLFTFVTQGTFLPEKPLLASRGQYAFVAALALALVAAAPVIHRIVGTVSKRSNGSGTAEPVAHGLVGGFILASMFTIWGTLTLIGVQVFTLRELRHAGTISSDLTKALSALVFSAAAGVFVYGVRTIWTTVGYNSTRAAATSSVKIEAFAAPPVSPKEAAIRKVPLL